MPNPINCRVEDKLNLHKHKKEIIVYKIKEYTTGHF